MKKLDKNNWDKHDETNRVFVLVDKLGNTRMPTGSDWAEIILEPSLSGSVPNEVVELFEVARSVLLYGWYFYPLYTTGSEQLFHVHETAISHRCDQLSAPKKVRTFADRIDWLYGQGYLTDERLKQWTACRSLRNEAAHRCSQSIYDPTMAVRNVDIAVELINELYAGAEAASV